MFDCVAEAAALTFPIWIAAWLLVAETAFHVFLADEADLAGRSGRAAHQVSGVAFAVHGVVLITLMWLGDFGPAQFATLTPAGNALLVVPGSVPFVLAWTLRRDAARRVERRLRRPREGLVGGRVSSRAAGGGSAARG